MTLTPESFVDAGGGGRFVVHMKKFTGTYENIISIEHLLAAWHGFARGKKYHEDVTAFQARLMENLLVLRDDLRSKTYRHGPYWAFVVSDPKRRDIHKAPVRDRVLHHLLYQALYPYFDTQFIHDSYSCRLEKGTHRALDRFRALGWKVSKNDTRTCWVLKCDIRKFFANIDHAILKEILARHIEDTDILALFTHVIDSFKTESSKAVGLPLGNLTSQLLVNIYMNEFDQFVKRQLKAKHYIRYADDFVFLHENRAYLENLIPKIERFLSDELKLSLHPDKVSIKTLASGIDFLGWVHFPKHRVLRTTTKRRMFRRIGESEWNEATMISYRGLLAHGHTSKMLRKLGFLG